MPVADIYGAQTPRLRSIADVQNDLASQDHNALALQQAKMQLAQGQQAMADQNALRSAAQGFGADPEANYNAILKTGNVKAAAEYQKSVLDAEQTRAKTGHENAGAAQARATAADKALGTYRSMLPMVQTPEQYAQWVDGMFANPLTADTAKQFGSPEDIKKRIPTDPQQFQQFLQMNAMGMDKFIQDRTTNAGHQLTATTTMRGQDMTDSRARAAQAQAERHFQATDQRMRESTAATLTKPFEVTGPDGNPMLVQQDKQGNISPVQGFGPKAGSAKPLTEAQAKELGYGSRMQSADKILTNMTGKYSPMAVNSKIAAESTPGIGGLAGPIANSMLSDESQQAEQAQRDFVNAILRRESGAAISASEFDNARKQYFPQPGDGKKVLDQKAANRKRAIEGVLVGVPAGKRDAIAPKSGSVPSGPKVGTIEDGHRFKGGNPGDPNNWEPI